MDAEDGRGEGMTRRWRTVWATCESDDRIVRLGLAGSGVVVSAGRGGSLEARRVGDGSLIAPPTFTGIPDIAHIVALVAWSDGTGVRAATGAGSLHKSHRWLQRWDLVAGKEIRPAIDMNRPQVKDIDLAMLRGEQVLVVINRGVLEIALLVGRPDRSGAPAASRRRVHRRHGR